jgi:cytochrome c
MRNRILWLSCFVALSLCQQVFANPSDTDLVAAAAVSAAPVATEAVPAPALESAASGVSSTAGVVVEQATQVILIGAPDAAASAPVATKMNPAQPDVTAPVQAASAPAIPAPPANVSAKPKAIFSEADTMNLAKKRGCFECHALDQKTVGPAWKDVAAKYRGDAGAQARLVTKILEGGGGVWGKKAMSAQTHTSKAERTVLVRFILNLK